MTYEELAQRAKWVRFPFGVFAFLAALWAVTDSSEEFRDCIHHLKDNHAYHQLHDGSSGIVVPIARVRLHLVCGFIAAGENEGGLAGLSGIVVAAFTGTLWWVTRKSVKAARISADAAREAADVSRHALEVLERPWLHFDSDCNNFSPFWTVIKQDDKVPCVPFATLMFRNIGRWPAHIKGLHCSMVAADRPPPISKAKPYLVRGDQIIQPSGDPKKPGCIKLDNELTTETLKHIRSAKDHIWVFGIIRYQNAGGMAETFETEFLWKFDGNADTFQKSDAKGGATNRWT